MNDGDPHKETRVDRIERDILDIKATLLEIQANTARTAEVVSAWDSIKGFVKTVAVISSFLKAAALPFALIGMLWYVTKTGQWPSAGK